ncbi:hypothetical protein Tco_0403865 [Tanacetum coccineum]
MLCCNNRDLSRVVDLKLASRQDLGFIPSGNVVLSSTYVGKILGADQLLVILCYRYQESGFGYWILSMTINGAGFEISSWRGARVGVRTYLLGGAIDGSEANGIIHDPKLELESSRFTFDLVPLSYESVDVVVGENWLLRHKAEMDTRSRRSTKEDELRLCDIFVVCETSKVSKVVLRESRKHGGCGMDCRSCKGVVWFEWVKLVMGKVCIAWKRDSYVKFSSNNVEAVKQRGKYLDVEGIKWVNEPIWQLPEGVDDFTSREKRRRVVILVRTRSDLHLERCKGTLDNEKYRQSILIQSLVADMIVVDSFGGDKLLVILWTSWYHRVGIGDLYSFVNDNCGSGVERLPHCFGETEMTPLVDRRCIMDNSNSDRIGVGTFRARDWQVRAGCIFFVLSSSCLHAVKTLAWFEEVPACLLMLTEFKLLKHVICSKGFQIPIKRSGSWS